MRPRFLIDECLHESLTEVAHAAGYGANHVNHIGCKGIKDWELMDLILSRDYTLVTNNKNDFLRHYGREALHAGLVIIVPNTTPELQRKIFQAILNELPSDLTNLVIEAEMRDGEISISDYPWPRA